MLKNFDTILTDLDSKTLKDQDESIFTLKRVVVNALLSTPSENPPPTGEQKAHRWSLAMKINTGGDQELAAEDIALIKKLIGIVYSPLIVGQVYILLEK